MEYLQKTINKIIFCTLVAIFLAIDIQSETITTGDSIITLERFKAFYNLSKGETRWPIWKNENEHIVVDGQRDEEAWDKAQPIYITGEWMWNKMYKSYPWAYRGLSDFVAIWRMTYDTNFLYVSCEYFDDFHSEGAPTEAWEKTDAAEITIRHSACTHPLLGSGAAIREIKVIRKFTAADGIRGTVKIRTASGRDTIIAQALPDGDPALGGAYFRAAPFCVKEHRYPGAWFMEIRIPRCNLTSIGLPSATSFKLGLRVYDDDSLSGTATHPVLGIGMERYVNWYSTPNDSTLKIYDPLPTFYLAGSRLSSPLGFPDEFNLYCGRTARSYYDSTAALSCESGLEAMYPPPANAALSIRVSPNPFSAGAVLRFTAPGYGPVSAALYGIRGNRIMDFSVPSRGSLQWDGKTPDGRPVTPGAYILRLKAFDRTVSEKVTIIR